MTLNELLELIAGEGPKHPNCRCQVIPLQFQGNRSEYNDLGSKLAAEILLADPTPRIVIPDREEWLGINLLERDGELRDRRGTKRGER